MRINVLGHEWDAAVVPEVSDDAVGDSHRDLMTITLDASLSDARRWVILWHELMHASLDTVGLEKLSANEQLVIALASSITSLLLNNPWLATPDATARVLKGCE